MKLFVLGILTACLASCYGFHFRKCNITGSHGDRLLGVTKVHINPPDPIHIPATLAINADIEVLHAIDHNYTMNITVQKQIGSSFIVIPCIGKTGDTGNVGTCHYDICDELNTSWVTRHCPVTNIPGYNCSCPVQPRMYEIHNKMYNIPVLPGLLGAFAVGDYKVKIEITDKRTSRTVDCWQITTTVTTD